MKKFPVFILLLFLLKIFDAYAQPTFDVVLIPNPLNSGNVVGGGLDIPYDSLLTILATPNQHFVFESWTEEGYPTYITNPSYTFPVTRSRNLTANFSPETFSITLSANFSNAGILEGGGTSIPYGTMDTIKAFPNLDYTFEYWARDSIDGPMFTDDAIHPFLVTQSQHFVAIFKPKTYNITVSAIPSTGGIAEVDGGGENIPYGQMVTVRATANNNYHFVKWMEDSIVSTSPIYPFPVTRSRHLIAIFELNTYDITVEAKPAHAGTVSGGGLNLTFGTTTSVTATPYEFFYFDYWTEEGDTISDDATFPFSVTRSRHLVANFLCQTFNINLLANPPTGGTFVGGGPAIPYLSEIIVFAIPDECYTFICWTSEGGDTISTLPDFPLIVNEDRTFTAHFEIKTFIVTATADPPEGGTVFLDTSYIDCGTEYTVTAIPNTGYKFLNWTRDGIVVSDSAVYMFPVTDSCHLVANFVYVTYNIVLAASPYPGGSVFTSGTYPMGLLLTVTAKAHPEYQFVKWTENEEEISLDTAYTFIVDSNRYLVAHFIPAMFCIELSASPLNGGSVEGEDTDIPYGELITVTATPNPNFLFDKWTEEAYPGFFSTDSAYKFAVTRSRHLVANFISETYNITLSANIPNGGILEVVDGGYNIPFGTLKTVIATPTSNHIFKYWAEDSITGPMASDEISFQFTVTRSRHLVAIFQPKNYIITVSATPSTGGLATGGGNIPYGTEATLLATPSPHHGFLYWTENDSVASYSPEYKFPVTRSRDLIAHFTFEAYHIILTVEPPESGTVEGTEFYIPFGTEKKVKAFPNEHYYFVNWTENGKVVSVDAEFEFTVTQSRYLVANFTNVTRAVTLISLPFDGGTLLGGGNIPYGKEVTIIAVPDGCYDFVHWTDIGDSVISDLPEYTFTVEEDYVFVAHFIKHNINITTSASPLQGGTVIGDYPDIYCGTIVTVLAFPHPEYTFVNWTVEGVEVSTDSVFTFLSSESCSLVANFLANNYNITLRADPPEMGAVEGGGTFSYGTTTTVSAYPYNEFRFIHWTEDSVIVSTEAHYTFILEKSRILTAHFERTMYHIIATVNDTIYGYATGSGKYYLNQLVQTKAFAKEGFQFANWTIDSVIVSNSTIYEFIATRDILIVANFYELVFDDYAVTLWDNTFMLNLKKLAEEGYEVTGCKWFKNGKEERETNTINEYSYSAGPKKTDLLELSPTYYMFRLTTRSGALLNSTKKILTEHRFSAAPLQSKLIIYPNPVFSGNLFTIEGVTSGSAIEVYNQAGVCVSRTIAADKTAILVLPLPAGVYIIHNQGKEAKIVVKH